MGIENKEVSQGLNEGSQINHQWNQMAQNANTVDLQLDATNEMVDVASAMEEEDMMMVDYLPPTGQYDVARLNQQMSSDIEVRNRLAHFNALLNYDSGPNEFSRAYDEIMDDLIDYLIGNAPPAIGGSQSYADLLELTNTGGRVSGKNKKKLRLRVLKTVQNPAQYGLQRTPQQTMMIYALKPLLEYFQNVTEGTPDPSDPANPYASVDDPDTAVIEGENIREKFITARRELIQDLEHQQNGTFDTSKYRTPQQKYNAIIRTLRKQYTTRYERYTSGNILNNQSQERGLGRRFSTAREDMRDGEKAVSTVTDRIRAITRHEQRLFGRRIRFADMITSYDTADQPNTKLFKRVVSNYVADSWMFQNYKLVESNRRKWGTNLLHEVGIEGLHDMSNPEGNIDERQPLQSEFEDLGYNFGH